MKSSSPSSFFKYFGHNLFPSERAAENSGLKVLENLSLKVTPPNEFNDPFEFSPALDDPVSQEEAYRMVARITHLEAKKRGLPAGFANDLARVVLDLKKEPKDLQYVTQQSVLPMLSSRYGVVCFSAAFDSLLMWSHYAAQHFGLMLEFSAEADFLKSENFFPVEYTDIRSSIVPTNSFGIKELIALACRKSPEWAYEQEYRLVIPLVETKKTGSLHLLQIKPHWIKSITVGQRASLELKSEVNKLVRKPGLTHLRAERYRMVMDLKKFRLLRQRIESF